jgi:hypothetical protein
MSGCDDSQPRRRSEPENHLPDETPAEQRSPGVMVEMGHTDPGLALRVYAQAMRRDDREKAQLQALVEGAAEGHAAMATALQHI